jgi:hypothetical protein
VRGGSRSEVSAMGDRRKCQTYAASPAEPGGLPVMLGRRRGNDIRQPSRAPVYRPLLLQQMGCGLETPFGTGVAMTGKDAPLEVAIRSYRDSPICDVVVVVRGTEMVPAALTTARRCDGRASNVRHTKFLSPISTLQPRLNPATRHFSCVQIALCSVLPMNSRDMLNWHISLLGCNSSQALIC